MLDIFLNGRSFMKLLHEEKLKKADLKKKTADENRQIAMDFFNKQTPTTSDSSPSWPSRYASWNQPDLRQNEAVQDAVRRRRRLAAVLN